jgi:hypothetical protein
MIVYGEKALQVIIAEGLLAIQHDQPLIKQLIQGLDQAAQDTILNYLTTKEIDVRLGFGREPWSIPQVCITLAQESEDNYIGDELYVEDEILQVGAQSGAAISHLQNTPFVLPYSNISNGPFPPVGRIQIESEHFTYDSVTANAFNIVGRRVARTHRADHPNGADISAKRLINSVGAHYQKVYRVDVIGDNADVVLWLYPIVKHVTFLKDRALDDAGFSSIKRGGTDYAARPQYYPEFVYQRTLTIEARVADATPVHLAEALSLEVFPTVEGVTFKVPPIIDL